MKIKSFILSPGHGKDTPGKRSPKFKDGTRFYEWEFNRRLVSKIVEMAKEENLPVIVLDDEEKDASLKERCRRANKYGKDCLYISVHGNACGDGEKWNTARGWCIYTSRGYTKADPLAHYFIEEAQTIIPSLGSRVRTYKQKKYEMDQEANFYVLAHTIMPAVLTENLFFTNKEDVAIMQSEEGIEALAKIHINAMKRIYKDCQ